jgi:hypothetical protein
MAKIPKFKGLEEAATFWDAHDFEDYRDDTEVVTITVAIPRRKNVMTIPVDLKLYHQMEALAAKRRVPVEKMVSDWLKDRAKTEAASR